jgi:hypothetical protein
MPGALLLLLGCLSPLGAAWLMLMGLQPRVLTSCCVMEGRVCSGLARLV